MKSLIHLLPLVCVFCILTSCGPSQIATSSNPMYENDVLYSTSWNLAEFNGVPIVRTDDRYSYISFNPATNRISGYTSCNYIGGKVVLNDKNGITLSPVASTKHVCSGNTLDVNLIPALRGVNSWAKVNDNLVMYKDGRVVARWAPSRYSSANLSGNWQLDYVSDDSMPFEVLYPTDKRPSLVFTTDKNIVKGTTGYNTYNCPMKITRNGITLADCTSTTVACEGPGEAIFMDNLKSVNDYTFVDDNTLVLFTNNDRVLRFTRIK